MTPLAIKLGDITDRQIRTFMRVMDHFKRLPDGLSCHETCAAIAQDMVGLIHYKGTFNGADHSWLVFADNPEVLIDAYPLELRQWANPADDHGPSESAAVSVHWRTRDQGGLSGGSEH